MPLPRFFALSDRWAMEQRRLDARVAMLAYVTASSMGAKRKGGGELSIEDFMPFSEKQERQQTPEEILEILMGMVNDGNNNR